MNPQRKTRRTLISIFALGVPHEHIVGLLMFELVSVGLFAWFAALVKWGVIPLLTLSGLWMWQGHKLRAKPPAES